MSSSFTFRQRVGRMDWKAVSSVSTEDIVLNLKISELQSILDEVTFCTFDTIDVKTNTVESITKLVQIMQLISEYLLHCQEAQFKIIKELNAKGSKLKSSYEKLKLENVSLKEDCKIYQRQLAMLRKSLSKGLNGEDDDEILHKKLLMEEWKAAQNADKQNNNALAPEIVESILQHERESRVYMLSLLDEQRKTFAAEMSNMMDVIRAREASQSQGISQPSENWIEGIKAQLESACDYAIKKASEQANKKSVSTSIDASAALRRSIHQSTDNKEEPNVALILKTAALETMENDLKDLERELNQREKQLKQQENNMRRELESEKEALRLSANRRSNSVTASKSNNNLITLQSSVMLKRSQHLAARTILSRVIQVQYRKKLRAFSVWLKQVYALRELEMLQEHGRILKAAAAQPSRNEATLHSQLEVERSKVIAAQARCGQLVKELEGLEAQLIDVQRSNKSSGKKDADLAASAKAEKERALVATAKYNTLLSKTDKERKELMDKLHMTEELLAKEASKQKSAPLTLAAPSPPVRVSSSTSPFPTVSTSTAPSISLSQFASQFMTNSEDELLLRAQQRVADRKHSSQLALEAKAMAALAQEINGKLYSTQ